MPGNNSLHGSPAGAASPFLIDWVITGRCNYSCAYCIQTAGPRRGGQVQHPSRIDALVAAITRLNRTCIVSITGGEPTVLPDFPQICSRLSGCGAYLEFFSNLSGTAEKWAAIVKSAHGRLLNVVAAFHPDHAEISEFSGICALLSCEQVSTEAVVVADPARFDRIKAAVAALRAKGVPAKPTPMISRRGQADYPAEYLNWIRSFYADGVPPVRPNLAGRRCPAGKDYVRLKPSGKLWMCATANYSPVDRRAGFLGDIETDGFSRLFGEEIVCPYNFCQCSAPTGLINKIPRADSLR